MKKIKRNENESSIGLRIHVAFRMDPLLAARIKREAKKQNRTVGNFMEEHFNSYFAKKKECKS